MNTKTFFEFPRFKNIKEIIYYTVEKHSDNVAFIIKEKKDNEIKYKNITYSKFLEEANSVGAGLYDLNAKRIAIISKNRYEWMLSYVGILLGGIIAVPLDKDLTEIEIENSLIQSEVDTIIYDKKYHETITKLCKNNDSIKLKNLICMDKLSDNNNLENIKNKGKKILNSGNKDFLNAEIKEKDLAVLVFTSGTTSVSKAVMLSQYNIASNLCDLKLVEDIRSTDVNLAFLPYHHTFGSTGQLVMICSGATTAFPDGLRYIAQNLKEYKITVFVGVPKLVDGIYTKLNKEIEKQGKTKIIKMAKMLTGSLLKLKIDIRRKVFKKVIDQLGGLRFVISGAAGLNEDTEKGLVDMGIAVAQGYGLTETSPVIAAENYGYQRYGSIGVPMQSIEVEIDNPNEEGIGELKAKGPNIMIGYYNNKEATDQVLKDGWFYTGDLARIDDDGYIYITGRKKNMIVLKNGKKIFPEEMELLIEKIDLVEECFVFGMPKGDDVLLSVKAKYDKQVAEDNYPGLNEEEIKKIVWEKIKETNKLVPNYKHIKNLILTGDDFIKTSTGKIKRYEEMKKININV